MPASSLTVSNLINYYSHRRSFRRESLRARKDYEVRFRLLEKVDRIYRIAKSEVLVANGEIGDEPIVNLLQSATPFIPTGQPSISCILFLCIRQYSPWSSIDVSNVLFLRSRPSRFVLARRPHAASWHLIFACILTLRCVNILRVKRNSTRPGISVKKLLRRFGGFRFY